MSINANRYAYAGDNPINESDLAGASASPGEYLKECGRGALTSVFVGVLDGTAETGAGLVADAAAGCGYGLAFKAIDDLTDSEVGTEAGFLKDAYEVAEAIEE